MRCKLFRFNFIKVCCIALPLFSPLSLSAQPNVKPDVNAYVGTYNPNGKGVYHLVMSPDGKSISKKLVSDLPQATQLIVDKNKQVLYVASEVDNYQGEKQGSIAAYAIEKGGTLKLINQVPSEGAGPVYLSIHPTGHFLLVANYISGSIAVFPVSGNGELSKAADVQQSSGEPGAGYPQAAAPGSFAISDHNGPHAHMIDSDPSGSFIFSTDLGLDRIYQWKFDQTSGKLMPNQPPFINASSAGAGPRHFVFHPNGNTLYLINEESSTLTVYDFNKTSSTLTERNSVSSLPKEYKGTSFASGIIISSNGKHLYVANRLHNSISHFAIDSLGDIKLVDNIWTRGDYTRTLVFSPDGQYLYAMNQRSDNVTKFKIDTKSGKLIFVDFYFDIGSPSQMVFN